MEGVIPVKQYRNSSSRNERPPEGMHILSYRGFRTPQSESLAGHITERRDPCRDPLLLEATPVTGTVLTQDLPVSTLSPADPEITRPVVRTRVKEYYQWSASYLKQRRSLWTKISSTNFNACATKCGDEGEA